MFKSIFQNYASRFITNARGSFAILFALSLLTILIAVGVALDIAKIQNDVMKSQILSDAAVLAGVKEVEKRIAEGDSLEQAFKRGKEVTQTVFDGNKAIGGKGIKGSFDIDFTRPQGEGTKGNLTFSGISKTNMSSLIGVPKNKFAVNASADYAEGIVNFIELSIVVDTSASMGLPSTYADQNRLGQLKGCSFACHSDIKRWRAQGITFRIDVVRNAVLQILQIFEEKGYTGERMAISVYTFGNTLHHDVSSTTDIETVKSFVRTIDLGRDAGTNTAHVLKQLSTQMGKAGDGSSAEKRKKYVAFFTDGLTHGSMKSGPSIGGLFITNPVACDPIKIENEATLFVFNVEYIANLIGLRCPWGHSYCAIPWVLKPSIKPRLTQCATKPEYAFPAETPEQIAQSVELFTELIVEKALSITH